MSYPSVIPPIDTLKASDDVPGEKLSWGEIRGRYPDRWVALVDYEAPNMQVLSGIVYAHDPDRAVLSQMTRHLLNAAILWTGKRPAFLPPWGLRVDR